MHLMDWNLSPTDAIKLQEELSHKLILNPKVKCRLVCGVDVAFDNLSPLSISPSTKAYAVCCSFSVPKLKLIEEVSEIVYINYPYIPGLFAFREGPALLGAIKKLHSDPDLVLFDGHGIAHPRRFGIASHIGYLLNKPTIGCAKTKLIGTYKEPGIREGSWEPLIFEEDIVGAVVRTKEGVKPVFVSPGNLMDVETSVRIVISLARGYRIPEPLRIADIKSRILRNSKLQPRSSVSS